jgi:hypothetical protein
MKSACPSMIFCFGLLLPGAVLPTFAQTPPAPAAPATEVKPAQGKLRTPLVARAPSRAEWTVRLTRSFDGGWESDASWEQQTDTAMSDRQVRSVNYSKDSELSSYRLKTSWSDGTSEEEWIIMGNHVAERAGGRGLYIVGAEQTLSKELGKSTDFPELNWVEPAQLKGVKAYKGRQVYVFQVEFDQKKLSSDEARMVAFARQAKPNAKPSEVLQPKVTQVMLYLDVETQLPVLYNDGSVIRRYDFSAAPSTRLQPPKRTMDFLKARADFLKKRLTPPAGPGG